jgi:hypothetical protein
MIVVPGFWVNGVFLFCIEEKGERGKMEMLLSKILFSPFSFP